MVGCDRLTRIVLFQPLFSLNEQARHRFTWNTVTLANKTQSSFEMYLMREFVGFFS